MLDWSAFTKVLVVGYALIVALAFEAWRDGHLARSLSPMLKDYTFTEHGGVAIADVFLITPMFAYFAGLYRFHPFSWAGLATLAAIGIVTRMLMQAWQNAAAKGPGDHCTHDGFTTPAGWIQGLYFMLAVWMAVQMYLGLTTPVLTNWDLLRLTFVLTPFWPLGVMKFNPQWHWGTAEIVQSMGGIAGTWTVCLFRIWWRG